MFATWTPKGNGLGQRLFIIHMLGYEGLLVSKNADGSVCSPGLGAGTPEAHSQSDHLRDKGWVAGRFPGNFDSEVFLRWARTHLLPVLKSRYRDSVFN